ncbi:MAG TPA: hypothetical protein VGN14_17505 [Candidatus Elarobacter sp.]|jgi:uncharacterized protein YcsI (UPF0317 family)
MLKSFVAALALVVAATAQSPAPAGKPLELKLPAQNDSGETGVATLQDGADGSLVVKLKMTKPTAAVQPAHIHKGTCDKLDPKPTYPLSPVKDGASETTIKGLTIADLEKAPFAINVHKSAEEVPVYVSCGNVVAPK